MKLLKTIKYEIVERKLYNSMDLKFESGLMEYLKL